jgi:hypothetical protein
MSESLVLLLSRANELHLVDPDALPHSEGLHPIILIAAAIINAGYEGVAVDQLRLSDGRYVQSMSVNLSTPEGLILQRLQRIVDADGVLPEVNSVLGDIRRHYSEIGACRTTRHSGGRASRRGRGN